MTGTVMIHTTLRAGRRLLTVATGAAATLALTAGAASADVPEGWPENEPVDAGFVLGALVGIPVLLFVLITLAVYLPAMVRGEKLAPGAQGADDLWLGGRRTKGEIAFTPADSGADAGDTDAGDTDAGAGGASARW